MGYRKYVSPQVVAKVKAVAIAAGVAAAAGVLQVIADVDWTEFGPFGPAIGLAIGAAVAYVKRPAAGDAPVPDPKA
jgi:hypothetical protein